MIWGLHNTVDEDSSLLRYDTIQIGWPIRWRQ